MSFELHCKEFLHTGDADVFLVALSEHISTAGEDVTSTLLLDQHETILVKLGWDILSLLTRHLHPSHPHSWHLIDKIINVCSPKEMTLALLEQMEVLSAQDNSHTLFMMLKPLQKVLVRVKNEKAVDSALHSVGRLLQVHCPSLNTTKYKGRTRDKQKERRSSNEANSDDSDSNIIQSTGQADEHSSELSDSSRSKKAVITDEVFTILEAIEFVVDFLHPFVHQLHTEYMRDRTLCTECWNPKQKECISILIHLLDQPLVSHDLDKNSDRRNDQSREMASSVMHLITMCHCGCVQLLTWSRKSLGQTLRSTDEEADNGFSLPSTGLACFAYLLFSEGMEESYYPAVMSPSYTLQINLTHVINLLEKSEKNILLKGLALLNSLIPRLSTYSLPSHFLDDKIYLDVAKMLTNLMTKCPHKKVRQQSVPLLSRSINCFAESGRHRFYLSLLHYVTHAGVKGLLLHSIKNEVDSALAKTPLPSDCAFFGSKLVQLLDLTMTISEEDELLDEMDRIMPALNFLRYLLIRDKPDVNATGIWDIVDVLQDQFISPLRALLARTRAHVKHDLQMKREEQKHSTKSPTPHQEPAADMTVEVMGELLPNVSLEDEIKTLHTAQSHMDMMESVLVRVEELAEYQAKT